MNIKISDSLDFPITFISQSLSEVTNQEKETESEILKSIHQLPFKALKIENGLNPG